MTTPPNELLRLTEIHGRGRSLVAAQPLKPGQIILRDCPLLLYSALPLSPHPPPYCLTCFTSLQNYQTTLTLCPSSPLHRFCSPSCLSSHSPYLCLSLTKLPNHPPLTSLTNLPNYPDLETQLRFLIAAYNLAAVDPAAFRLLLSLQGQPHSTDEARLLHSLVSVICPPDVDFFTAEMTAALLAKEKLNAFGVMEPVSETGARSSRAYGIYAKAAFFNHDCLPNACRFDYVDAARSAEMTVRMIHEVPEGREVCLSYFPVNEQFVRRQKVLKEDYGFVCECDRCKVEANWSDDEGDRNEEVEADEGMEEDEDEEMGGDDESGGSDVEVEGMGEKGDDFPHAYFFVRFMCGRTNCGGTLAPLPPGKDGRVSDVMECNVCGTVKKDEVIGGNRQNGFALDG